MASPFLLAILALWGLPAALLAGIAASLLDDLADRSSPRKTAFNLSQTSLALAAAGLVYGLLADGPVTTWRQLPAFGAAAVANLTLSEVAVRVVVGLERQAAHTAHLLPNTTMSALTAILNAGLTGAVLLAVPNRTLVPLILAAPILPVYLACQMAARERQARATAENNQLRAEAAQILAEKARAEAEAARIQAESDRAEAQRQATERANMLELARGLARRLHGKDRHSQETMALVALDLQEPLRLITAITTSLANDHRLAPAARQELHMVLLNSAEDASAAAQRLLTDAPHRRTQPTEKPSMIVIDTAELIRDAGQLAAVIYDDRPILVHTSQRLPVHASPEAIDRILSLLLDNVGHHTPTGSLVQLEALRRDDLAVLAVQDHGPGIPPADRDRIFDQFTRLHGKGLGLGLHIARALAREQGGELIAVDPHEGHRGARVELTLPLAESDLPGPTSVVR
jgi:signal transduction histidine kinase